MALTVETGTGSSTADSYVSVTDCDTYHSDRGNSTWTGTTAVKEESLRIATQYLDDNYQSRWPGDRANETQALAWPRQSAADADGYAIDSDAIPQKLKDALCEAALIQLTDSAGLQPSLARGGAIQRARVEGVIDVSYSSSASRYTTWTSIELRLNRLLRPAGILVLA